MRILPFALLTLMGCGTAAEPPRAPAQTEAVERAEATDAAFAVRGLTFDARQPPPPGTLKRVAAMGVTHLVLIPFAFQEEASDPRVRFNPEPGWYSEATSAARAMAAAGDSMGFEIVLKPQLWIGHSEGAWSATIGFETEADWQVWEDSYRTYILHHARTAAEIGSSIFVIGTELGRAVRERPDFFRALIAEVRAVFPGRLTYAANWHDDVEHVAFWDRLDYVGVQAYYPLAHADSTRHTSRSLASGWTPHADALRTLSEETGRPVLFTEVGYRSIGYAAAEPWRWPSRDEATTALPDTALQAALYTAFFERYWHEPWVEGAFFWKWTLRPPNWGRSQSAIDFSPIGKPAERVLADWYTR